MQQSADHERAGPDEETFWRRTLHRWFVEYNPFYLLSASLVLCGMFLVSRGLAREGIHGELGVAAIAEVYALALIGGAALLTRIGHRRPAVMLALLTVLYQCDLTLHTETCTNLGVVGLWATSGWLGLFVVKLRALAWAMKFRLSHRVMATTTLAGLGLAVIPHVLAALDARASGGLVALWLCSLALTWRPEGITSLVELDAWGQTVTRRAVRAMWLISGLLVVLHTLFWSLHYSLEAVSIVMVLPVLGARWIRSERRTWLVVGVTLLLVALHHPASFAATALVASLVLARRAWEAVRLAEEILVARPAVAGAAVSGPYRVANADEPPVATAVSFERIVADARAARLRLLTGAAVSFYLALWTMTWKGGHWPAHVLALDVLFTVVAALAIWRARARASIVPAIATWLHFGVQVKLLVAPSTALGWGVGSVVVGFALLLGSLATSYWLRPAPADRVSSSARSAIFPRRSSARSSA